MESESAFEPVVLAFCCNWCAYAGADLAGTGRSQYPSNLRIIRVMCSGMVHPNLVIEALTHGADGVLVLGCHRGDCHYLEGNLRAEGRSEAISLLLEDLGLERERFRLEWVSASEGPRFARVVEEMVTSIRQLGPGPYSTRAA
jgi:F420-non-reducing hydrogenase iron-sulfur subunit